MRAEGREYVVQDGDIMLFRFNVERVHAGVPAAQRVIRVGNSRGQVWQYCADEPAPSLNEFWCRTPRVHSLRFRSVVASSASMRSEALAAGESCLASSRRSRGGASILVEGGRPYRRGGLMSIPSEAGVHTVEAGVQYPSRRASIPSRAGRPYRRGGASIPSRRGVHTRVGGGLSIRSMWLCCLIVEALSGRISKALSIGSER